MMDEKPLNVGLGALTLAFGSLVAHLDAKGLISDVEFAGLLEDSADNIGPGLGDELKSLAQAIAEASKTRQRPILTSIEGGKPDDPEDNPAA
jgi:hypothetical protein